MPAVRAGAVQRRRALLEATLRVMRRGGLRAVSHRAVAAEAGLPLAATTYYFRSLDDLITEAFLHWSEGPRRHGRDFHEAAQAVLVAGDERRASRALVARRLAEIAARHVIRQARTLRSDRVLEFAFLHEAARMPKLRAVVRRRQVEDLQFLEQFHAALGSRRPQLDAYISLSVILGLERAIVLSGGGRDSLGSARAVLRGYLRTLLGPGD